MVRAVLLAALVCLANVNVSAAQSVLVRAGDHPDFTRLVFEFPEGIDWALTSNGDRHRISTGGETVDFNASGVFSMISRDRVAQAYFDASAGEFVVETACSCQVRRVPFREAFLVLDFLDPGEPASAVQVPANASSAVSKQTDQTLPVLPAIQGTLRPVRLRAKSISAMRGPPQTFVRDVPLGGERRPESLAGFDTVRGRGALEPGFGTLTKFELLSEPGAVLAVDVASPRRGPLRQIESILPDLGSLAPSRRVGEGSSNLSQLARSQEDGPDPEERQELAGLTAPDDQSEGQIVFREAGTATPSEDNGRIEPEFDACLGSDRLSILSWGQPDPLTALATARANLFGEFDTVDEAALEDLVTSYLYLGFGAEVQALLAAFPGHLDDEDVLGSLARVVEDPAQPATSELASYVGCDTEAALWGLLASTEAVDPEAVNSDAVVSAFSSLPVNLRQHLVWPVGKRLLDQGFIDEAHALKEAVRRAPGPHGLGLTILDAHLGSGDTSEEVLDVMLSIAQSSSAIAASSMAEYLGSIVNERHAVSEPVLELAQILAFENRRQDVSRQLVGLVAQSLAFEGRLQDALDYLARSEALDLIDAADFAETFKLIAPDLIAASVDGDFAILVHSGDTWPRLFDLNRDQKEAIALRLADLGFWDRAAEMTRGIDLAGGSTDEGTRVLLARILRNAGQSDRAIRLLADGVSKEAAEQKAELARVNGDYRTAAALLLESGAVADALADSWRSGDLQTYERLSPQPEPWFDLLAQDASEVPDDPDSVLGDWTSIVGDSELARAHISELLEHYPRP